MRQFHPLRIVAKTAETRDSVRIALDVPSALRQNFGFRPGQHLPLQAEVDGERLRRTYSICSEPGQWPLQIGIRVQPGGRFSEHAAKALGVGDELEVMPPTGRFHVDIDPQNRKYYVAFAAGSGITPILSIAASVLRQEPRSRFALFYGNRTQRSTMFVEDLYALKNLFPNRLQLHFVFSREETEFEINAGRLDADRVKELHARFCRGDTVDEAFVCGPGSMIDTVVAALTDVGVAADAVHAERFGVPRQKMQRVCPTSPASVELARVTVIMDGHKKSFEMARDRLSLVDAAAEGGIELPYSCKGGVCATCRTHLRDGEVRMDTIYGLEPWEIEAGFILACQSRPVSDALVLDYDKA